MLPRAGGRLGVVAALFCALVLPGCATPEPRASQQVTGQAARGLVPGEVTEVARGLAMPWGLTFLPDGSALVSERSSARILHVRRGRDPVPVGTVPGAEVSAEGGLLGLAASPSFDRDRTVYAYVSASPANRVVALRLAPDLRSLRQDRVVLDGIATADRHHGGRLRFGPDGNLWIGTGDAFSPANAADEKSLNGKILRVRPDGSVPPGNPSGTAVYSGGHRNVQGIAFGPDGTAYASELGHRTWDELNVLRPGRDYGWPGRIRTVEPAPDGSLWITTSNTDGATWGGTDARPGDDRILRVDLVSPS